MATTNGGQIVPYNQKVQSVRGLLEKAVPQIRIALPRHLSADRMLRIAMTSIQKTPALLDCSPQSLLAAVIGAAQLGLEPDGVLGHAYLVPYGKDAQLIVGYRGMIDLARRSGQIVSIHARAVHQKDDFKWAYGLSENLEHKPFDGENPGPLTHVYAVAKLKDGGVQFEVMARRDVDAIRTRSRAGQSGPWKTDYEEMAKKTVIRRLFKLLPVSVEMARAAALDEAVDVGLPQDLGDVIDTSLSEENRAPQTTADLAARDEPGSEG